MIIVSGIKNIPLEIQNYVNIIEWRLPTGEEIIDHLKTDEHIEEVVEDASKFRGQSKSAFDYRTKYSKEEVDEMQKSLSGLSIPEIDNIITFSQIRHKEIVPSFLMEQKKQLIMKNGLLEYHDPKIGMDEIGGMDLLKDWVGIRKRAFGEDAKKFGIENPKGVMLVGIQGCGKSHMAKAIAHALSVPLLRFDVGKVFSKTVGSSEENVRNVLALIDAVGDCVVMIDEIEKGLAGVQSSNQSDGGTTARVVGTLLSWLNDKTSSSFIVATANDIKQLPPELQRKGRFDELFFIPLPEAEERKAIFEIHLQKRGRDPKIYNTQAFAEISPNFSGAECEEAIKSALIIAFNEGKQLEDRHVIKAIKELIPLFKTCEEDLKYLYNWVGWDEEKEDGVRARFASSARKKVAKKKGDNVISFTKGTKEPKEKE